MKSTKISLAHSVYKDLNQNLECPYKLTEALPPLPVTILFKGFYTPSPPESPYIYKAVNCAQEKEL